jgi:hypothetical protein
MATSKPRTSPGINQSTVNKTYKNTANSSSYLGNIGKEIKQRVQAFNATWEASQQTGPGTDERANRLRRKEDKATGQLIGAVFLGRKYDDKTGKRVK